MSVEYKEAKSDNPSVDELTAAEAEQINDLSLTEAEAEQIRGGEQILGLTTQNMLISFDSATPRR